MSEGSAAGDARRLAGETANALLGAGALIARGFAESVSGRPEPIVPGEAPLASLVRHASVGAVGVARIVMDAVRSGGGDPESRVVAPSAGPGPRVSPGGTLRVPLSVDNPGATEMGGLVPAVLGATCDGVQLTPPEVRFLPETLTIGPRDFEKLVVSIDLPANATEGLWRLSFTLGGDAAAPTEIAFRVASA